MTKKRFFLFLIGCVLSLPKIGFSLTERETPVVKVVRDNAKSVVNISTERIILLQQSPYWGRYGGEFDALFEDFFGFYRPRRALRFSSVGSGVVVDPNGLVITNAHVVHMASNIVVIFNDGTQAEGQTVYESAEDDLAVVKIQPPFPLKAVSFAKPGDVLIGESVVAIGNPLGLENSVSTGVISGKNRDLGISNSSFSPVGFLQTDAPINPGNSGGALLNLDGELMGINVAVVKNSQSIGFAIPVERVSDALDQCRAQMKVTNTKKIVKAKTETKDPSDSSSEEREDVSSKNNEMEQSIQNFFGEDWKTQTQETDGGPLGGFDVRMTENPDAYLYEVDISGLKKGKVHVEVKSGWLIVKGERSEEMKKEKMGAVLHTQSYGEFIKTMSLPQDADTSRMKTVEKEDVFTVVFPRKKS